VLQETSSRKLQERRARIRYKSGDNILIRAEVDMAKIQDHNAAHLLFNEMRMGLQH